MERTIQHAVLLELQHLQPNLQPQPDLHQSWQWEKIHLWNLLWVFNVSDENFSFEVEFLSVPTEEAENTAVRMEPTTQTAVKMEEKVDEFIPFLKISLTLQPF
jgi:hypothetical protein